MKVLMGTGNKIKKFGLGGMLLGVMSISLVACGGGDTTTSVPTAAQATATSAPTASTGGGSNGSSAEATVKLSEWAIALNAPEVPAGKVKFNVTNDGKFAHNYVILEGSKEVGRTTNFGSSEGPQVIEVDLKPGAYTVLCDIPGHTEQGMVNKLTVR